MHDDSLLRGLGVALNRIEGLLRKACDKHSKVLIRSPRPMCTSVTSKIALRQRFRDFRCSLTEDAYTEKSASIVQRVLRLPEVRSAEVVHTYWPLPERREVDTRPFIQALDEAGVQIALPVVTSYPPNAPEMAHRRYTGMDSLVNNRWGIPEPKGTPLVFPPDLDAVIVPALGADHAGHRLGQGAGYYDAFLSGVSAPRIVLTYADTLVHTLPAEPHDVPATIVVTESEVRRP